MQTKNIHYKGNIYIDVTDVLDRHVTKDIFEHHLSKFTHYPYIGEEKLLDGQWVVENIDYKLQHQYYTISEGNHFWADCTSESYKYMKLSSGSQLRIVAIGIPKATVEGKKSDAEFMQALKKGLVVSEKTEEKETEEETNYPALPELPKRQLEQVKTQLIPLSEKTKENETQEGICEEIIYSLKELSTYPAKINFIKSNYHITRK